MALEKTPNYVEHLVDTLGPTVATLAYAPAARATAALSGTVIVDINDPLATTPGGVALLVGVAGTDQAAVDLTLEAATHQFGAVVIKRHGRDLDKLLRVAQEVDIAVIIATDEISWRHLEALLMAVLSSAPNTRSEAGESGGDQLFSVANAVSAVIGGSVSIEDLGWRVLAYSSVPGQRIDDLRRQGILDRRVPQGPQDDDMYRQVMSSEGVVRFPQAGSELPRAAAAIRAGSLPLGTLWAIESDQGLSAQAEAAILDGARLAALHLLTAYSAPDLERIRRGDLLRNLLDSAGPPEPAWSRLGFRPGDRLALVAVAPDADTEAEGAPLVTHISREVDRLCVSLRPDAPVTTRGSAVYVMLAGSQAGDAALRLANRLVPEITRVLGGRICAAVSGERNAPELLPALKDEVDQVLRVNTTDTSAPTVAALSDVQSAVMLLHVGDSLGRHPEIRQSALEDLIALDRERNTELAATLLAWLEMGQSVQAAADRLHVHANTLRYRLGRLRQILSIDLNDPDERLTTWLELRLIALRTGGQ